MRRLPAALLPALFGLAACGAPAPGGDAGDAERPMEAMRGMASMDGMSSGEVGAAAFWDSVRAHLDSVVRVEPNRLVFVRAAHDSLAHRALARMDREMEELNMPARGAWQALADSVRRDLTALGALTGEAFVLGMRAHAGRLRRLINTHQAMMGRTPM